METRGMDTEDNSRLHGSIAESPQSSGRPAQAPTSGPGWSTAAFRSLDKDELHATTGPYRLDLLTRVRDTPLLEEGILSIVRREHTYQVRYASYDPYAIDRTPYWCADEATLVAWLRQCGLDAWALQQAVTTLRKGGSAVLPVVLAPEQIHTNFPLPQAAHP